MPVDGRVVEGVAAIDVGLRDGDALLEADGGESVTACAGSLTEAKSASTVREKAQECEPREESFARLCRPRT
mgnify:FL=1